MRKHAFKPIPAPARLADYPVGPTFAAGYLVEGNAGMRTFRPVFDAAKCVGCLRCYLLCPDGAVVRTGDKVAIDYDFCKGCGVCAHECKVRALAMVKEGAE